MIKFKNGLPTSGRSKANIDLSQVDDVRINRKSPYASEWDNEDILTSDISQLGFNFKINTREALKYRVRRKRMLMGLIRNLGEIYNKINILDNNDEEILPPDTNIIRRKKMNKFLTKSKKDVASGIEALANAKSMSDKFKNCSQFFRA